MSALRSSRPLLLLLLHSFYLSPYQVTCFSQHRDCSTLLWVVQFHQVLHLPDTLKRACQPLRGALLLLLLLLLLLAASLRQLTTFGHMIPYLTLTLWH